MRSPVHAELDEGRPDKTASLEAVSQSEAAIAWIVTNQLARRNLTPSQKEALALELEKQLAVEAKKRQQATLKQNQSSVVATSPQREQGLARDKAAEMIGASPRYVQDAKQIAKLIHMSTLFPPSRETPVEKVRK